MPSAGGQVEFEGEVPELVAPWPKGHPDVSTAAHARSVVRLHLCPGPLAVAEGPSRDAASAAEDVDRAQNRRGASSVSASEERRRGAVAASSDAG